MRVKRKKQKATHKDRTVLPPLLITTTASIDKCRQIAIGALIRADIAKRIANARRIYSNRHRRCCTLPEHRFDGPDD